MILNQNQQSDVQTVGDIQNNKVGIDTENIDFITSLLTTNLYSQPIQSFIRETVANGWDSHIEAGTTDKPVIIRVYNEEDNLHIAVRDYGTGLSPQRFNEIYLNIGSSTKRDSNDYIGSFGIGRWTQLAVADVSHITNYYNGTCTKYVAYKDNGKICIDKLFENATEEDNGLEIDVCVRNSYTNQESITDGLEQLTYYDNVYLDCSADFLKYTLFEQFNNRKIKDYKTFKVNNWQPQNNTLLMGNVLYPIDRTITDNWFKGIIGNIPFSIKCNIGEVDVTPNREALLYNQKTLNTLNRRCEEAVKELQEIIKESFDGTFNTIQEYYNVLKDSYLIFNLTYSEIKIDINSFTYYGLSDKLNIRGKSIPVGLERMYRNFIHTFLPYNIILYKYENNRFLTKCTAISIDKFITNCVSGKLYTVTEPLDPKAKKYFSYNHDSYTFFYFIYKKYSRRTFISIVHNLCKAHGCKPTDEVVKFIYDDFVFNYSNTIPSYGLKDVPQSFIDSLKQKKSSGIKQNTRKCVIYKLQEGKKHNSVSYDSSYTIENLNKLNTTTFFAEKGNILMESLFLFFNNLYSVLPVSKVLFVEVAPSNIDSLRNLKNCVEFNSIFTKKNNLISKLCTYIYLAEKWSTNKNFLNFTNIEFVKQFADFSKYMDKLVRIGHTLYYCYDTERHSLLKDLCTIYYKKEWLNYNIINIIEENKQLLSINRFINEYGRPTCDIIYAMVAYFTKNGLSNQKQLKQIKETLKPILYEYSPNQKLPHFDVK